MSADSPTTAAATAAAIALAAASGFSRSSSMALHSPESSNPDVAQPLQSHQHHQQHLYENGSISTHDVSITTSVSIASNASVSGTVMDVETFIDQFRDLSVGPEMGATVHMQEMLGMDRMDLLDDEDVIEDRTAAGNSPAESTTRATPIRYRYVESSESGDHDMHPVHRRMLSRTSSARAAVLDVISSSGSQNGSTTFLVNVMRQLSSSDDSERDGDSMQHAPTPSTSQEVEPTLDSPTAVTATAVTISLGSISHPHSYSPQHEVTERALVIANQIDQSTSTSLLSPGHTDTGLYSLGSDSDVSDYGEAVRLPQLRTPRAQRAPISQLHFSDGNARMVEEMKFSLHLTNSKVENAFLQVPRALFIPEMNRCVAYAARPIRIVAYNFNCSSPEVHAAALDALQMSSGDVFLDIGSGCGHLTAMGAYLIGPTGLAVGVELEDAIVDFSAKNVQRCRDLVPEFAANASRIKFYKSNIFLMTKDVFVELAENEDGQFDKIHCGATCPQENLSELYDLLKPGGVLVTPCESSLIKIAKPILASELPKVEFIKLVRYGDLVVPSYSRIFDAKVQGELRAFRNFASSEHQSTLLENMKAYHKVLKDASLPIPGFIQRVYLENSDSLDLTRRKLRETYINRIGTDMTLLIDSAELRVHKPLLAARCGHFRALFMAGMRDSNRDVIQVPKEFDPSVFVECLRYLYTDECCFEPEKAAEYLQIGRYYDFPCCFFRMCEGHMAKILDVFNVVHVYLLCKEAVLLNLKREAIQFIIENLNEVQALDSWSLLDSRDVSEILVHACDLTHRLVAISKAKREIDLGSFVSL